MGGIASGRNSKAVTRCIVKVLLDAQVNLRCDYGSMTKRKLYLLQGRMAHVSQFGERPPHVVRANFNPDLLRVRGDNPKDRLR